MDEEIRVKVEGRGCGRPLGDEIQQVTAHEEGKTYEVDRNLHGR
jgi:hypothetical protein